MVRRRVGRVAGGPLHRVLLGHCRGDSDSIGRHADDEPDLGANFVVPSLPPGAERRFGLLHNKGRERME